MEKYTIFSIDDVNDIHALAKFTHYLDVKKAMQELKSEVKVCVGSYKGQLETSFLMRSDDFERFINCRSGWPFIKNQESILRVSECNKQYATLEYLATGKKEFIGSLKCVDKDTALKQDAWTYRPDVDQYWIAVQGNPDRVNGV